MKAFTHLQNTINIGFILTILAALITVSHLIFSYNIYTIHMNIAVLGLAFGITIYNKYKLINESGEYCPAYNLFMMHALVTYKKEVTNSWQVKPIRKTIITLILLAVSIILFMATIIAGVLTSANEATVTIPTLSLITGIVTFIVSVLVSATCCTLKFKNFDQSIIQVLNAFEDAHPELDEMIERGAFAEKYLN